MKPHFLALPISLLLGACATGGANYPSLAIRDAERVTGTLQPAPPAAPEPPSAGALASVDGLVAQATSAYDSFRSKLSAAQSAARGGRGADWAADSFERNES